MGKRERGNKRQKHKTFLSFIVVQKTEKKRTTRILR